MSEQNNIRDRALKAYQGSELWEMDQADRKIEQAALRAILKELGSDAQPQGTVVEVDGITLTAHHEPSGMGSLVQSDPLESVYIQAHERCNLCDEMRHSDPFSNLFGFAAELGRWLADTHDCSPSSGRPIGFERSK